VTRPADIVQVATARPPTRAIGRKTPFVVTIRNDKGAVTYEGK